METIKPETRCECTINHGTIENDKSHLPCCPHWEPGEDWQCYENAVRLVTVRVLHGHGPREGMKHEIRKALCTACADYHEKR